MVVTYDHGKTSYNINCMHVSRFLFLLFFIVVTYSCKCLLYGPGGFEKGAMTLRKTTFRVMPVSIAIKMRHSLTAHGAEYLSFRPIMLSIIILSVIMLSVIMLSVIMLSVIMLSVIMLSVIMLSVIVLSVIVLNVIVLCVVMLSVIMLIVIVLSAIMLTVIRLFVIMLSVKAPKKQ